MHENVFKNSLHVEQVYQILYAVVKKLHETYDASDCYAS